VVVPKVPKRESKKKKKAKMSVGESFAFLAGSRYIRDLAMLVVAYGISINLVEVTWKSKIKAQFPNPNDYSAFMGDFSTATGAVTFTMMILSRYIFKYFGWGTAALITPTVLLITGIAFFSLVLFRWVPLLSRVNDDVLCSLHVASLWMMYGTAAHYVYCLHHTCACSHPILCHHHFAGARTMSAAVVCLPSGMAQIINLTIS
jgi:AAA family ATP:ADP antiporter